MAGQSDSVRRLVEAKTANYTITDADYGKIFTNRGDTDAITFTLPNPTTTPAGVEVLFFGVADFAWGVATTADKMTTFNDATATSITISEAGHLIGTSIRCINDGTTWLAVVSSDELNTAVIA